MWFHCFILYEGLLKEPDYIFDLKNSTNYIVVHKNH